MSLASRLISQAHRVPVAIIGGGVEAFTTALSLHRGGIRNNIFLHTSTLTPKARSNVFIGGSAVRILDRLGLGSEYRSSGTPVHHASVEDRHGRNLVSFRLDDIGAQVWSVPKDHLLQVIFEALPPESVRFDAKFRSLQADEKSAEVRFLQSRDHRGPVEPTRNITCETNVIIGADGMNSVVRPFVSRSIMSIPCGVTVWRAVVHNVDTETIPLHTLKEIWDANKRFGYARTTQDEVMWWAVLADDEEVVLRPFMPRLMRFFADFPKVVHELISSTNHDREIHRQEMKRVLSEQSPWVGRSSRMALVGDAARPGSAETFHASQSFAIEDSYLLANFIIEQKDKRTFKQGLQLDNYHESREEQVNAIAKIAKGFRRLTVARSPVRKFFARKLLKRAVDRVAAEGMCSAISSVAQLEKIPGVVARREMRAHKY